MHTLSSFTLSFFFPNKEMVIVLTLQEYAETDNVTDVLILRIEQSKLSKMLYYLMNTLLFIYFFIIFLLIFYFLNFLFCIGV